jgi:hypothetical protein
MELHPIWGDGMKAAATALVVLALTSACSSMTPRAEVAASSASSNIRSQIVAATAAWNKAIVEKDTSTLQAIRAPEFTLTGDDDTKRSVPRDPWMQNLQKMTISHYDARVVDVRSYGKIAVSRINGGWDRTMNGKRVADSFDLADFWVLRDGRWQVFKRHTISRR